MLAAPRSQTRIRARSPRIVSVCVLGPPVAQERHNESRIALMGRVVHAIRTTTDWRDVDAVLFPAGYFRGGHSIGPQSAAEWATHLIEHDPIEVCRTAARKLDAKSPGCVVVAGWDMPMVVRGRRGDQLMTAWDATALVGCARKFLPVDDATDASAYPVFLEDVASPWRFIDLPSGATAALWVCFDAWAPGIVAGGPTGKRKGMRYSLSPECEWTTISLTERNTALAQLGAQLDQVRPAVSLIGIHKFARPGREIYWQRHGVASVSAALGGGLSVAASHFVEALPDGLSNSPLAAHGVVHEHLTAQHARRANALTPTDGFVVSVPGSRNLKALVRLFQTG